MGRNSALVTIAFLAGLGIGVFTRSAHVAASQQDDMRAADLAAIEKLHKADEAVTLSQDPKGLVDIWDQDGVRFSPGNPPAVGKQAIAAENEKFHAQYSEFKVLKYAPDYKSMQTAIVDGWAIEVSYTDAIVKMSANADPMTIPRVKGMRLLKRQSDGSWKFALVGMK